MKWVMRYLDGVEKLNLDVEVRSSKVLEHSHPPVR
jgi:hypothetical protein